MKLLPLLAFMLALSLTACSPQAEQDSLSAAQATAKRITQLEKQVDRLRRAVSSIEQNSRLTAAKPTKAAAVTPREAPRRSTEDNFPIQQVLTTLAEDLAALEQSEETTSQSIQTMNEAIVALEQAVVAIDAEIARMRQGQ